MGVMGRAPEELRRIVGRYRRAFLVVVLLSSILNVLVLGGSIYMLMVYDSVLPSHSLPTLFGLFLLLLLVYGFQGTFDAIRSRILADVANSFDQALSLRVQRAMADAALQSGRGPGDPLTSMRDLENVRGWLSGPGPATLIDMPWMVFFVIILMLMHVWIGVTALVGGAVLLALTLVTDRVTREPTARLSAVGGQRYATADANMRHVDLLTALGMRERMLDRWQRINGRYLAAQRSVARSVATLSGISRIGRMLLQSLILTVGALLVIDGKASSGIIIASSILSARALAPVDQAIATWRSFAAARIGWDRLCLFLAKQPAVPEIPTLLPPPVADLTVEQLVVAPPGSQQVTVQGVEFTLKAGDGLAIIGPSAAGKSSLGRALVGIWRPLRGTVSLDGAALDQWPPQTLGGAIGYLPQTVELFEGTVAENIARFEPQPASEDVIAAARAAGVHEMIVRLPQGYETPLGNEGRGLSSGQLQRIGLARALYRDPFLILLDEPNANLDAEGDAALEKAITGIRARGGIVIVIAHRSSALKNVNHLLLLREGRMEAMGPRDEILQRITRRPATMAPPREDGVDQVAVTANAGG